MSRLRLVWRCPFLCVGGAPVRAAEQPGKDLITQEVVDDIRQWLMVPVVRLSIEQRNRNGKSFDQATIDAP